MAPAGDETRVPLIVACTGFLLLGLCGIATFRNQDVLAGGLAALGLAAIVIAALTPRLTGNVEVGPSGFKLELAQRVAAAGDTLGYPEAQTLEAVRGILRGDVPRHGAGAEPMGSEAEERIDAGAVRADERAAHIPTMPEVAGHPRDDELELAQGLLDRWQETRSVDDLEEAIRAARQAAAMTSPADPTHAYALYLLARGSYERYQASGDPGDGDRAIGLAREVIATAPPVVPIYDAALRLLARALQDRSRRTGDFSDRDEAIEALRILEAASARARDLSS